MSEAIDVLIVGSGATAVHAARPLVESGLRVVMLDVGNTDRRYAGAVPPVAFRELRASDQDQHRYFLGDDFEGIPFGDVRVGAQLTPPRQYISAGTGTLTPLASRSFRGMESLAMGGLGCAWGAASVQFDDRDLAHFPIRRADLGPHYDAVSAEIGISGAEDDLLAHFGPSPSLQPPLDLDSNGEAILARYARRRSALNDAGFFLGRPRLAVLSRDLAERKAQPYADMDFYANHGRSVYRPSMTLDELRKRANFTYLGDLLVRKFRDQQWSDRVGVEAVNTRTGAAAELSARRLVLAAGTFGSARIVLRSLDRYDVPVPLVCNPYTYAPCVNTAMLGKVGKDRRHSLAQLAVVHDTGPPQDVAYAEIHSYRSLLLFKIAKESFLPVAESWRIMRELQEAFVVLSIHHADYPAPEKTCLLKRGAAGEPDVLEVHYELARAVAVRQAQVERHMLRQFRRLGCWSIKRIHPGHGASIHYGGCFPMCRNDRELTTTPDGLLRGTRRVYLADGCVFPYLPAKGLTLTLMANGRRVGSHLAGDLGGSQSPA